MNNNNRDDVAYGLIGGLRKDRSMEFSSLISNLDVPDSEVVQAIRLAFKMGCVLKVPTNYLGDKIICEEHEIKNIEDFMREFGLIY